MGSRSTHHCHCVTGQYGAHIQDGVVGHVGEDVDDGDDGHRDGDRQRQVPGTVTHWGISRDITWGINRLTTGKEKSEEAQEVEEEEEELPLWVLDLLSDKVQSVPAGVGEESRVERQGDVARICGRALEGGVKVGRVP